MSAVEISWPKGAGSHRITLAAGEWMRCPCSTHRAIFGPCVVEFDRHRDGGITIRGEDGHEGLVPL